MRQAGRSWTRDRWVAVGGLLAVLAGAVLLARTLEQRTASFAWSWAEQPCS